MAFPSAICQAHSIGTTMLEYPAIGASSEVPLEEI